MISAINPTATASPNPVSSAGYTNATNSNKPVDTNSKCLKVQHNDN